MKNKFEAIKELSGWVVYNTETNEIVWGCNANDNSRVHVLSLGKTFENAKFAAIAVAKHLNSKMKGNNNE